MSCSEGDSKPALGEGPKVFMLAEAISDIRKSLPSAISCQGGDTPWRNQFFISTIITGNYFDI